MQYRHVFDLPVIGVEQWHPDDPTGVKQLKRGPDVGYAHDALVRVRDVVELIESRKPSSAQAEGWHKIELTNLPMIEQPIWMILRPEVVCTYKRTMYLVHLKRSTPQWHIGVIPTLEWEDLDGWNAPWKLEQALYWRYAPLLPTASELPAGEPSPGGQSRFDG